MVPLADPSSLINALSSCSLEALLRPFGFAIGIILLFWLN